MLPGQTTFITLHTVSDCVDCEAIKWLPRHQGAATEKNVWGDAGVLAEMQRQANVHIARETVIRLQAFYGSVDRQQSLILGALAALAS